jgi:hypothetical protein
MLGVNLGTMTLQVIILAKVNMEEFQILEICLTITISILHLCRHKHPNPQEVEDNKYLQDRALQRI